LHEVEIIADVLDGRVDLVSDSGGEMSDGFHLLRLQQLRFDLFLTRQVAGDRGKPATVCRMSLGDVDLDRELGAVFAQAG